MACRCYHYFYLHQRAIVDLKYVIVILSGHIHLLFMNYALSQQAY